MNYKALIVDVDGTLIPNYKTAVPSKKVIKAIKKASNLLHVGIATARPPSELIKLFSILPLSGPSIINSGSQIIELPSQKILIEQPLEITDVYEVINIAHQYSIEPIIINDTDKDLEVEEGYNPQKPFQFYFHNISQKVRNEFLKSLSRLSRISVHKTVSWKRKGIDIVITHAQATKQHGILEVAKLLGINTHEIIGVGDGYNDFPLLMACGLKIAMGNAVKDLKAIADYIAPNVEEDGLVDIIEKFVLKI